MMADRRALTYCMYPLAMVERYVRITQLPTRNHQNPLVLKPYERSQGPRTNHVADRSTLGPRPRAYATLTRWPHCAEELRNKSTHAGVEAAEPLTLPHSPAENLEPQKTCQQPDRACADTPLGCKTVRHKKMR